MKYLALTLMPYSIIIFFLLFIRASFCTVAVTVSSSSFPLCAILFTHTSYFTHLLLFFLLVVLLLLAFFFVFLRFILFSSNVEMERSCHIPFYIVRWTAKTCLFFYIDIHSIQSFVTHFKCMQFFKRLRTCVFCILIYTKEVQIFSSYFSRKRGLSQSRYPLFTFHFSKTINGNHTNEKKKEEAMPANGWKKKTKWQIKIV